MKYYRTYNVVIGVFVVVFAGIMGSIWHFSKPVQVNAAPVVVDNMPPAPAVAEPAETVRPAVKPSNAPYPVDVFLETVQAYADSEAESDSEMIVLTADEQGAGNYTPAAPQISADNTQPKPIVVISGESSSGGTSSTDSLSSGGSSSSASPGGTADTSSDTPSSPPVTTGGGAGSVNPPTLQELSKPQNIGAVFLRQEELALGGRPLPLTTAMENLLRYDAFWSAGTIANMHPKAWSTLRNNHPDKMALFYVTPTQANSKIKEHERGIYSFSWLDYDYINRYHPEWFLLKNDSGQIADFRDPSLRIPWRSTCQGNFEDYGYRLDVGNPDFQDWAVQQFLKKLDPVTGINARIRYSGIAADNVQLDVQYTLNQLYPQWKYRNGGWNQAFFAYLEKLRKALNQKGYILVANQTLDYNLVGNSDWLKLMNVVDGAVDESTLLFSTLTETKWNNTLKHHEDMIENGLYDWWIANPHEDYLDDATQEEAVLFVYCSFLLTKKSPYSIFGSYKYDREGKSIVPMFDFYRIPLGEPVSSRYRREDCWLRDYQYGKVVVNPSDEQCRLSLDSNTYMLDWVTQKKITQVTLGPKSATILLPTGYLVK